jgi:hypothetical protein
MKDWINKRLVFLDQQWPYNFTGIENQIADQTIRIFPNPFTDRISVQLAANIHGEASAEIFSSGGVLVRKINFVIRNGLAELNLSGNNQLSPGLYVLKIRQNNRILLTEKVVRKP